MSMKKTHGNKGRKFTTEHKQKIGTALKGIKRPYLRNEDYRKKMSDLKKGSAHWNWKGGITPLNKAIRESFEYKLWREAVYARDNWTCQICSVRGGNVEADHIKPFSTHPELRFAIDNGRTLCSICHRKTPTYGNRKRSETLKN